MLTILITNYKTIDFIKLSLYALKKLTKNSYKVLINDNGSSENEINELKNLEQKYDYIKVNFRKTDSAPSYAHGEALDILIPMVDTKYFVVLDSDCTFLMKHWDDYMISQINDKVKVIGTTYTINGKSKKKNDFPAQFAVLFETEIYKSLNISCMPKNTTDKDTCWEWREKFFKSGYEGKIFNQKNTREFLHTSYKNIICMTFYNDDDELIASHFGRGSSGGEYKYSAGSLLNKLPIIGKILRKNIAKKEKMEWIKKSKQIIDTTDTLTL